jgi:hypothetical protein
MQVELPASSMELRRTVPVKLDVADSDVDLLHQTISEFL